MRGSEPHFALRDADMQCSKRREHKAGASSVSPVIPRSMRASAIAFSIT